VEYGGKERLPGERPIVCVARSELDAAVAGRLRKGKERGFTSADLFPSPFSVCHAG